MPVVEPTVIPESVKPVTGDLISPAAGPSEPIAAVQPVAVQPESKQPVAQAADWLPAAAQPVAKQSVATAPKQLAGVGTKRKSSAWKVVVLIIFGLGVIAAVAFSIVMLYVKYYQ
jgi:hypothetical protein